MTVTTADRLDLGAVQVPGGFFVPSGRRRLPFDQAPATEGAYRHCYTYERSPERIAEAAIDLIDRAESKIFLASFRLGDDQLQAALYRAVDRLCGGVYVITEIGDRSLQRGIAAITDEDDTVTPDVATQNKRFNDMTRHGVYVRGHGSCHAKFLVVDDRIALVSSANLESSALHRTGENGVVVDDPVETERLARFFTRLWYSGCTWEVPPGPTYLSAIRKKVPTPCHVTVPEVGTTPGMIWTHDDEQLIHETVLDVIDRAQEDLTLATFALTGLTDRPDVLCEPLDRAVRAGVRVNMLVRSRNHVAGHRRDAATIAKLGVTVHADSLTHAKGVIADRRHGALFSANFDVRHGLFAGVEVGTRLDGLPALTQAADYFDHAMANADMRLVVDPAQRLLDTDLRSKWHTRWPHGSESRVVADDKDWSALRTATGPILYTWDRRGPIRLYAGDHAWELVEEPRAGHYELRPRPAGEPPAAARLDAWMGGGRGNPPIPDTELAVDRGWCSAVFTRVIRTGRG